VDREITPFTPEQLESLKTTKILPFSSVLSNLSHPLVSGFAIDSADPGLCEFQFSTLAKLADKFSNVSFTIVNESYFKRFCNLIRVESMKSPFFFVINLANPKRHRWFSDDPSLDFHEFVSDIVIGKNLPEVVSEPVPENLTEEELEKLVGLNFEKKVLKAKRDSIVVFTREESSRFKFFKPVVEMVKSLVKDKKEAKFYYLDLAKNDIPDFVPQIKDVPTMVSWPREKKGSPVVYRGNGTVLDVMAWVKGNAGKPLEFVEYDLDDVKKRLADTLRKIRFG
jgi:hypothetical protein